MSLELFSSQQLYGNLDFPLELINIIYEYSVETDEEKIKRLVIINPVADRDIVIHPNHLVTVRYIPDVYRFVIRHGLTNTRCHINVGYGLQLFICNSILTDSIIFTTTSNTPLSEFISVAKRLASSETTVILIATALYSIHLYFNKPYVSYILKY